MALIGAAMRKLMDPAYGVLKTARPFDPGVGAKGLTSNTVSHPRPCATYMRVSWNAPPPVSEPLYSLTCLSWSSAL